MTFEGGGGGRRTSDDRGQADEGSCPDVRGGARGERTRGRGEGGRGEEGAAGDEI